MRDNSSVEAVKSAVNIVDVVQRYVNLRQVGGRWMGPCPFHQETKPSFSVNGEEGFYYCFGCQAGGDVIDFYCRVNGLEFKEGLEQLAAEAGITLERYQGPEGGPQARQRKEEKEQKRAFFDLYARAVDHYRRNLTGAQGGPCREYLNGRRLSREIIDGFSLGYSLPQWDGLRKHFQAQSVREDVALASGLLTRNDRGNVYDRFRGRLMFPIMSLANQVVAFGGRVINPEDEPKYINSSESAIYVKGDHLYGLAQARRAISQSRRALLTEGYMDVLTLHQFGYANSCGVLGTALTDGQVKRLSGFCSGVDLLFDGDEAGRKAAHRSAEMIVTKGLACRVATLPEGEDVDSLLHNQGREALDALLDKALDGLDFCLRFIAERYSAKERFEWAKTFVGRFQGPDLLFFSNFPRRLAHGLELEETTVREMLETTRRGAGSGAPVRPRGGSRLDSRQRREERLLEFAIRFPHHIALLAEKGADVFFTTQWGASFWHKLKNREPLGVEEQSFRARCMQSLEDDSGRERELLDEICARLEESAAKNEKSRILARIRQGGDFAEQLEYLKALERASGRNDG